MNNDTPKTTPAADLIKARLLELATQCARGQIGPGALARESFLLGRNIGIAEERTRQARKEGGHDERH